MTPDALDHAACGLMQTDDHGVFRRVNRVFARWVGYAADELVGRRRFEELLTAGGRIFHHTHWMPLLAIQGSISEVKLELLRRDGERIPMVLNAIRREEDGAVVHELAAFVARDRDRYEQELVRTKQRLEVLLDEHRDRALFAEQLIGIVSHDLRSPINTISMASEMLADPDAPRDRLLATIDRSIERSTRLLEDLLDFTVARVGNGLSVATTTVDLHATVAEIVEATRVAFPAHAILLVTAGEGPCDVDRLRLAQLLGNLVANAVTYGDPAAPIEIASRVDDATCRVAVTNAGPEIPADKRASLFEPMTRGSEKGRETRSVGLGLFIVQHIAKAHGGVATVDSAPGRTTFAVEWPRRRA